ncbi:right-handed parallel beta-helix repeat-containing protein [Glycomyces sp. L485]|uniref:right-handed parallel beta-helix repeat-containing protein n=1 Tax=Glycomyces sp. L485 TaxID=2909235 RepID=UPI001F4B68C9|nr:right-handed parallel beta-helix repeat-containing protein [Glycomyces sp. L485]MCH7230771.1 right-handed parallel beta-helix repeat-containing protein [Glycomyces sp. L485]
MSSPQFKRRGRTRAVIGAAALAVAGATGIGLHYGLGANEAAAATHVVVDTSAELHEAISDAAAGDVIRVKAGTYYPSATLKSKASGTASNRITLEPYGNGAVIVDGSNLPDGNWLAAIHGSYWHVHDMTFQNSPAHGFVVTSSTGGVFDDLVTRYNGDTGFNLRGENTVNNLVEGLDSYGNYDASNNGENADGIAVKFGSGSGNVIRGARLYENADDGLDFWSFSSPVRVESNWAWGNGYNRWNDRNWQGDGNGFKLGGGGDTAAHVIVNNAAWSNAANGFTENSNPAQIQVYKNTAWKNEGSGFWFQTGHARLARNLSVDGGVADKIGSRTVSAANSWDSGVSVPSFRSTDARQAVRARDADGSLPAVNFLSTGSTAIGSTMTD